MCGPGGFGLVGACDMVIAGPESTFALTEARIGVAPAIISLTLLPKLSPRADRYYLTGEVRRPARSRDIGLITMAADDVDAEIVRWSPTWAAAATDYRPSKASHGRRARRFDRDAERA